MKNEHTSAALMPASTSRRTVLKGAAWAAPVVAVSISAPLAAATNQTVNSDLVVSFGNVTEGSTRDITMAVVDFIEQTIRSLGPQEPVMPELVIPYPQPVEPPASQWWLWPQYLADMAAWTAAVAAANPGHAQAMIDYAQALAEYGAWDIAVTGFTAQMRQIALQSEGLFYASATYPRTVSVTNFGPDPLPAGTTVTVQVVTDINLVNGYFPNTGAVQAIQTGGTTLLTYTTPAAVPVGAPVFTQDLVYNPVAVTLNITGSVTQSSVAAAILAPNQDPNGDTASSPVGIRLDVATGDVQAILAEWQQFLDNAAALYDLLSPFLPELDWNDIISGVLPLPAP